LDIDERERRSISAAKRRDHGRGGFSDEAVDRRAARGQRQLGRPRAWRRDERELKRALELKAARRVVCDDHRQRAALVNGSNFGEDSDANLRLR
jgi:hypothetical protein